MEILILLGIGVIVSISAIGIVLWVMIKSIKLLKIRMKQVNKRIEEYEQEEKAKKSQKKQTNKAKGYVKNGKLCSPTGWEWDEDAKLWVPPKKR